MSDTPSQDDLDAIRHLVNNRPEEDFCGLSPNEMHELVFDTYEESSPLKINSVVPDQVLDRLPFLRLTEEFLKIVQRDRFIKLTPLGALPKKTLTELYDHRYIRDEMIELGITTLSREAYCNFLSTLHYNTVWAGLLRKANGRLTLSKTGKELQMPANRNALFLKTLNAYTEKLAWSDMDGFPAMPVGNLGWGFTLYMLSKEGDAPREANHYAEKYLKAFPEFLHTYPKREFSTPVQDLTRCYCLRTFERFLEWWGFVRAEEPRPRSERELTRYMAAPELGQVFHFDC
ncbi:MAG TPA: hypothetical protein VI583_18650 [Cyclobacteriaceae bacterium]|nr:hypothetical protein [Cyclobacteriaceae bacterium]